MKNIPKKFYKIYLDFYNSIAFYPIIISLFLFILAFIMSVYETAYKVKWIDEYSFLWVKGNSNARDILTTIIAGIISLTVLSFSMVMIVLSQASSNFSPRVIPGLITQRSHQIVLGFYLGTIIYGLILLHNIKPEESNIDLPQLGIFLGELMGVFCLTLFVYFIHSISKSIQIDRVIFKIFNDTKNEFEESPAQKDERGLLPDMENWNVFNSLESGYYRTFEKKIIEYARKNDIVISVLIPKGKFILKNHPFLKVNKKINEEEFKKVVYDYFIFHNDEYIKENFIYGFKQLSEIAVKALSPGINDPGSAVRSIEHLVLLFEKKLQIPDDNIHYDNENNIRLIQKGWSLEKMLYSFLGPIREYGKENAFINIKLLEAMKYLLLADTGRKYYNVFINHIKTIAEDADRYTKNSEDRKQLNKYLNEINKLIESSVIKTLN